ncbi:hypothetical protein SSBR45G_02280 [Bradyrhizobium sp. SSBR45G]|uniref:hypothetical protein n=1 Tax=unclassified Bradyrhizobium TaxID=2631580 RepID=UPI002342A3A4|nr:MULTISPECIES: hypothetical protein [unclassified Bradyrhizobium]GLH75320.1 hypothetical protein SSBR45G_02280 [Bradyrhizobium sp. SSBR45G]GLH82893.1 hypothetical protein SSBR45R_03530 [Bradyrhizobium sp. SSBR45R]
MKKLAIAMGLLILVADGATLAQSAGGSSGGARGTSSPEAPRGHRQPRPSDLPKAEQAAEDSSISGMSKEDRELDRKIKSICRGC